MLTAQPPITARAHLSPCPAHPITTRHATDAKSASCCAGAKNTAASGSAIGSKASPRPEAKKQPTGSTLTPRANGRQATVVALATGDDEPCSPMCPQGDCAGCAFTPARTNARAIDLTAERARELFRVEPVSGLVLWAAPHGRWGNLPAGVPAGCLKKGYRYIGVQGRNYFGHQIAWLMHHGELPHTTMDHINGCRDDNRPENLRLASAAQNNQNHHRLSAHNSSGCRGVSWDSARGKWTARISVNGRAKNLGRFDTKEQASEAYRIAKRTHHPFSQEATQ